MGDFDNAQDKTAQESGDRAQEALDQAVKEGGPEIPGQDQQTKIDRASGDKVDRVIDRAVKEGGPEIPGHD